MSENNELGYGVDGNEQIATEIRNIHIPDNEKANRAALIFEGLTTKAKAINDRAEQMIKAQKNPNYRPEAQQYQQPQQPQYQQPLNETLSLADSLENVQTGGNFRPARPTQNTGSVFDDINNTPQQPPQQPQYIQENQIPMNPNDKFKALEKQGMPSNILESLKNNPPQVAQRGPSATDYFDQLSVNRNRELMGLPEQQQPQYQQPQQPQYQQPPINEGYNPNNVNNGGNNVLNELASAGLKNLIDESLRRILPDVLKEVLNEADLSTKTEDRMMHFKIGETVYTAKILKSQKTKKK